jgi:uncharacterized protein (DUF1697 family)
MRWIALLRGVNVNGVTVKSAPLRSTFERLGFGAVRTVLASGNLAFDAGEPGERAALKARIEQALRDDFGYDAWIVLVTQSELAAAAGAYPFDRDDDVAHPYVVFGSDDAVLDELVATPGLDPAVERVARGVNCLYWRAPKGSSTDTAFAKVLAKSRHRVSTTNRNLRTVAKLTTA